MPTLTRREREERIQRDNGNVEDTVYSTTSYHSRSYHEDKECHRLKGAGVRERRRGDAQRKRAPCLVCVLGETENSHNQGGISKLERLLRDDKEDPELLGGAD